MSQLLLVRGGRRLEGEVAVQGAKNSVLPILAATLLAKGQVVLRGCPRLRDVDASVRILRHLGCEAHWEADALAVDTAGLNRCEISDILMREMRSSAIFLGAILARCGRADLSYPGGCELGPRPIDLHLSGLRELGAEIREEGGFLHCRAPRLRGRESGAADALRGRHGEFDAGRLRRRGHHGDLQRRPGAGGGGPAGLPQRLRSPRLWGGQLQRVH